MGGTTWRRRASRNLAAPRNAVSPWGTGARGAPLHGGRQRQIRGSVPSHGARVLEVRIHLPPAASLPNFRFLRRAIAREEAASQEPSSARQVDGRRLQFLNGSRAAWRNDAERSSIPSHWVSPATDRKATDFLPVEVLPAWFLLGRASPLLRLSWGRRISCGHSKLSATALAPVSGFRAGPALDLAPHSRIVAELIGD